DGVRVEVPDREIGAAVFVEIANDEGARIGAGGDVDLWKEPARAVVFEDAHVGIRGRDDVEMPVGIEIEDGKTMRIFLRGIRYLRAELAIAEVRQNAYLEVSVADHDH